MDKSIIALMLLLIFFFISVGSRIVEINLSTKAEQICIDNNFETGWFDMEELNIICTESEDFKLIRH